MPYHVPRCEIVPLPKHQTSLRIDGVERVGWYYGSEYPRPFFYPFVGPSGASLTRMGHPGAPNHEHHRSIWFAHHQVLGIDFWSDVTSSTIRQKDWLCYVDGDDAASLAVKLGWYDGHDPAELLEQEVIATLRPADDNEMLFEIQTTFRPTAEMLEFGRTNFGFLAVRVAKSIAAHFGAGELTNSDGLRGEPEIFGKPARWMDYSGPVASSSGASRTTATDGITFFDHASNPRFPTPWHVREDGWMGAAPCLNDALLTTKQQPMMLRYLLHAHGGEVDASRAERIAEDFYRRPPSQIVKATVKHQQFEIQPIR